MGLLSEGSPLSWEETKKYADHVRKHGIIQFINLYRRLKKLDHDELKWGDEVEYMIVAFDKESRKATLALKADELLEPLQKAENENPSDHPTTWRPEYAAYMVEGTPGKPYGHLMAHFNLVESNMRRRRLEVRKLLNANEAPLSLTAFPRLGCGEFTKPHYAPNPTGGSSRSLFFPEEAIYQGHPRFRTLTRNIRERRGKKVVINVPIYRDVNTPNPFRNKLSDFGDDGASAAAALDDHVYMDCMGFGMGNSCLQMTFQACNINEARLLYDKLTPLCPIMLALSAACPIYRGFLSNVDCRWQIIAASVDDRTEEERGEKPLADNRYVINKSRYDSIDSYLHPCSARYNDTELVMDEAIREQLVDAGIDDLLAKHIAHLFIRDPISLFSEKINIDDDVDTDHFENIQSTNWQTMRFKPPPPGSNIGWRVEFRPTEVQITDFENAAYAVFIVLITRVILSFELNFVIPISKVDDNMKIAQKRDAVLNEKFYFRTDVSAQLCPSNPPTKAETEYEKMTIDEIINGKKDGFPGLVPLIYKFLDSVDDCDVDTRCTIEQYLTLISKRASGELKTTARWIRDFVQNHSDYKKDSVVSDVINYDLLQRINDITEGRADAPDLLPKYETKSKDEIPVAKQKQENAFAHLKKTNNST